MAAVPTTEALVPRKRAGARAHLVIAPSPLPAVVYGYTRRSKLGSGESVEIQEAAIREWVAREFPGCTVVIFCDPDRSASRFARRPRPKYLEMMQRADAREARGVIFYNADRITRRVAEMELLIAMADRHPDVAIRKVNGFFELSTAEGRANARDGATKAEYESDRLSERVCAVHAQRFQAGAWSGGSRPFGFQLARLPAPQRGATLVHDKDEADAIRDAVAGLLDGTLSLRRIAEDWNARFAPTRGGKGWTHSDVRRVLAAARNAGYREHSIVERLPDGTYRPILDQAGLEALGRQVDYVELNAHTIATAATWDPIVDRADWERLLDLFDDPARMTTNKATDNAYLLAGLVRCHCGQPMRGKRRKGTYRYECGDRAHNTISGPLADELVDAWVREELTVRPGDRRAGGQDPDALEAKIVALEADLEDHVSAGRKQGVPASQIWAVLGGLNDELAALRAQRDRARAAVSARGVATTVEAYEAPDADQRATLRALIDHVEIGPGRRGRALDIGRVKVHPA